MLTEDVALVVLLLLLLFESPDLLVVVGADADPDPVAEPVCDGELDPVDAGAAEDEDLLLSCRRCR